MTPEAKRFYISSGVKSLTKIFNPIYAKEISGGRYSEIKASPGEDCIVLQVEGRIRRVKVEGDSAHEWAKKLNAEILDLLRSGRTQAPG
jgi:hypothetical protein